MCLYIRCPAVGLTISWYIVQSIWRVFLLRSPILSIVPLYRDPICRDRQRPARGEDESQLCEEGSDDVLWVALVCLMVVLTCCLMPSIPHALATSAAAAAAAAAWPCSARVCIHPHFYFLLLSVWLFLVIITPFILSPPPVYVWGASARIGAAAFGDVQRLQRHSAAICGATARAVRQRYRLVSHTDTILAGTGGTFAPFFFGHQLCYRTTWTNKNTTKQNFGVFFATIQCSMLIGKSE